MRFFRGLGCPPLGPGVLIRCLILLFGPGHSSLALNIPAITQNRKHHIAVAHQLQAQRSNPPAPAARPAARGVSSPFLQDILQRFL